MDRVPGRWDRCSRPGAIDLATSLAALGGSASRTWTWPSGCAVAVHGHGVSGWAARQRQVRFADLTCPGACCAVTGTPPRSGTAALAGPAGPTEPPPRLAAAAALACRCAAGRAVRPSSPASQGLWPGPRPTGSRSAGTCCCCPSASPPGRSPACWTSAGHRPADRGPRGRAASSPCTVDRRRSAAGSWPGTAGRAGRRPPPGGRAAGAGAEPPGRRTSTPSARAPLPPAARSTGPERPPLAPRPARAARASRCAGWRRPGRTRWPTWPWP